MSIDNEIKRVEGAVKKNPALGVAGVVILIALLVYLRNRVAAASTNTPGATTTITPGYAPATGSYSFTENIQQTPAPTMPALPMLPAPVLPGAPTPTPIIPIPTMPIPTIPRGTIPTPSAANPLIPFSFFRTHQFPTIPGNSRVNVPTYVYKGTAYRVQPGANGRVYGTPVSGGGQVLLYAPASSYH